MQISLNTQKYDQNYYQNKLNQCRPKPSFGSAASSVLDAGQAMAEAATSKSKFMQPLMDVYDNVTNWLAKNLYGRLMNTGIVAKFAEGTKDSKYIANHIMTLGAATGTGMYIYKTLKLPEDKMDSDRKKVLALNHALTFGVSTAGAYLVDGSLFNKWRKVTQKYAELYTGNKDLGNIIKGINDDLVKAGKNKIDLIDYASDYLGDPKLVNRLKGMDVGKTLLIVTLIYRYLVPVAVTPIANKVGDKFLLHKKAQDAKLQKA